MKTKTIELYEFEELSPAAQAHALDNLRDINVDGDFWYDYDGKTGFNAQELKRMRLSNKEWDDATDLLRYKRLYFSIDRSWYIQFVDAEFYNDEVARKFLGVPKKLWECVSWTIEDCPSREGNTRLEYSDYNTITDKDFTLKQLEILERAVKRFNDKISEALKGLSDSWDYLVTDEAVKDTILANEYTFTVDGELEN